MSGFVRRHTLLESAAARPYTHRYLLKRPRTHEPADEVVGIGEPGEDEAQVDDPVKEKRRFELFIDLLWVGIIGNLADHFSEQAYSPESHYQVGRTVFDFIILFLLAWRIWKSLQDFMSKYRTNDVIERLFVVWALVLAMGYGNNAVYVFDDEHTSSLAISIYLVFKGSLLVIEAYYSLHIPHIRRRVMLQAILSLPALAFWIASYWLEYPTRAVLIFIAVIVEYWTSAVIETPLADRFIRDKRKEILNTDHWVERLQDFYIIILGEGVLNLIRGSPLGEGITPQAGAGVSVLWLYYVISCLFFNGDSSRRYIHATQRTWWRKVIWLSCHVNLFGATLILGSTINFLIQHLYVNAIDPSDGEDEAAHRLAIVMYTAKWTASSTLSLVLIALTAIALLSRSLDIPGSLKFSNRYVRMLPRVLVVIVALCLPIDRRMNAVVYLGILVSLVIPCLMWEWAASLEHDGGFIEPGIAMK